MLAHQVAPARIVGMHGDRRIAQHRLRAGGGDGDEAARRLGDRVAQVPQAPAHLLVLHLEVGNRGQQLRVPVHQPAVAVDETLAIQGDKLLPHRLRQPLVHGEPLARPIERGAEPAELAGDGAARLRLPLPDSIQKRLASEGLARCLLFGEQPLHHHLGGDAGMVGARLPQRIAPLHPPPADQHVLHREGQGMAHVQAAGDVRRRDHDGEGLRGGGRIAGERAACFPALVDTRLDLSGRVGLVQHPGVERRARGPGQALACLVRRWRGRRPARSRRGPAAPPAGAGECPARS